MILGLKLEVRGSERFFHAPPLRWWAFLADTVLFVMSVSIDAYLLVKYWKRLPLPTVVILLAVAVGMLLLWTAALNAHRKVHAILENGMPRGEGLRSAIESVMQVTAVMIHLGLFYTFILVGILFTRFDSVLRR